MKITRRQALIYTGGALLLPKLALSRRGLGGMNQAGAQFPLTYALAISGDATGNQMLPPVPYTSQVTGHVLSGGFFPFGAYDGNPVAWGGRFDALVFGGNYEQADSNTFDRALLVDATKQICPLSPTYCIQYDMMETMHTATINTPTSGFSLNASLANQVNTSNWWLRDAAGGAGNIVITATGPPPFGEANWAVSYPGTDQQFAPARTTAHLDGLSEDFPQFAAAYFSDLHFMRQGAVTTVMSGTITGAAYQDPRFNPLSSGYANHDINKAPNMNALYWDDSFCYPRYTGFYNLAAQELANTFGSEADPWMARGLQHSYARFKAIMAAGFPTRTYGVGGNIGGSLLYIWQNTTTAFFNSVIAALGPIDHLLFEPTDSFETTYGTAQLILGCQ